MLPQRGDASLEAQKAHGDLPAITGRTDDIVSITNCVIEIHLVEFGGTRELRNGSNGHPRLIERDQEKAQAVVTGTVAIDSRQYKNEIGLVCQRGPYLLPRNLPLS